MGTLTNMGAGIVWVSGCFALFIIVMGIPSVAMVFHPPSHDLSSQIVMTISIIGAIQTG